jgi:hypothetical protein
MNVDFQQPDGSIYSEPPTPVSYYSVGANADRNGNWVIDGSEGQDVSNLLNQLTANMRFKLLAHTDAVSVCQVDPGPEKASCKPGTLFTPPDYSRSPSSYPRPNDTIVSAFSAQWPDPLHPSSGGTWDQRFTPIPADGGSYWLYNHKTLGNPNVAAAVLSIIRQVQPVQ